MKSLGAKSKAELSAFGKAAAAKRWKKPEAVGGMFSAGAQQLEALAEAVGLKGAVVKACDTCGGSGASPGGIPCLGCEGTGSPEYLKAEQVPKPRRPLPKAGTVSALVLEVLRGDGPNESVDIAKELYYSAKLNVRNTTEAYEQVKNALSSLRSGGHVVSEPKPGSRREKLWRLA
jgi:hypothetical protein